MAWAKPRDKASALAAIRLVAAKATKLADDLEKGRLWEGEYEEALAQIQAALSQASQS